MECHERPAHPSASSAGGRLLTLGRRATSPLNSTSRHRICGTSSGPSQEVGGILRNWVRQAEADAGQRHDRPTTDMLAENRRLAAENAELRRVNEVLRAASAYFASEIGPTRRWS